MTIKEAQEAVDKWIKEYGVRYFSGMPKGIKTTPSLAINKAFWDMRFFTIKGCTSSKTRMRFVSQYKSALLACIKAHH